jgi:histidyl-tRNA synthetase
VTLVSELRAAGLSADRTYGSRSAKKQWGVADRVGARWGVMLGPRELADGKVAVKDLASSEQHEVPRAEVSAWLKMRKDESAS